MRLIRTSSDWHNGSNLLKDCVVRWIEQGQRDQADLFCLGDGFDTLPYGFRSWSSSSPSIVALGKVLDGYPLKYIAGNHDPLAFMKVLLAPWPNIEVMPFYNLSDGDHSYYLSHGHQWSIDWGYAGLSRFAPCFVNWMVDHQPVLWWHICKARGWLASAVPPTDPGTAGVEHEGITGLTRIIWNGATSLALRHNTCCIFGHTHASGRETHGISRRAGFRSIFVDGGDLPDGTFCEITDDARLVFSRY